MDIAIMALSGALVTMTVAIVVGTLAAKTSKAQAGEATALVLIAKLEAERSILIAQNAQLTERLAAATKTEHVSGEIVVPDLGGES